MPKKRRHLSDSRMIDLLVSSDFADADEKRTPDREHLADCSSCHERLESYRSFTSTLRLDDVWEQCEIATERRPEWIRRVTALMQRLRDERIAADEVVNSQLNGPSAGWRPKLVLVGELHTMGMIDSLLARGDTLLNSSPADALELTSLSAEIADALRIDAYPFDMVIRARARAWRDHAFNLFYLGRFADALRAVDRAEQLFRQVPVHDFDLARVKVIRANIFRLMDRVPEAIPLTQEAAVTFALFNDRERYVKARMSEALMLFQQGRIADALDLWQPLEHDASIVGDVASAMVLHNIGCCYRNLEQFERATDYFHRAIGRYEQFGATAEIIRTRWALGQALVAQSRFAEGLPVLREAWRRFEEMDIEGAAALAALEVVEVLLILEQPDDVPAICRSLLDQFTRNGMTSRAATALAYLREAAAMGRATPALVRHVHDFIRDIPQHPTRAYAPPVLLTARTP
jgi:tetratricopeptide (TPR) repeat protein